MSVKRRCYLSQLSTPEMEELVEAFKHPTQTRDDGIVLDGVLFKCIRADKFSVYGKKVKYAQFSLQETASKELSAPSRKLRILHGVFVRN